MNETNHNPDGKEKPRPLVLTATQKELADKLREVIGPWFDQSEYEQAPLAHGFTDCMAVAIESAGRDDPDAMRLAFQWAYNYYVRLSKAEKEDVKFPVVAADEDSPPYS